MAITFTRPVAAPRSADDKDELFIAQMSKEELDNPWQKVLGLFGESLATIISRIPCCCIRANSVQLLPDHTVSPP